MAGVKIALLLCFAILGSLSAKQPHIVVILADDFGWNDIGYHGNKEVKTPNLDRLAADGIKLENHYVQPVCTPSRSQLLSGRYQIHTGLQHRVILNCQANGLPLDHPTIADQLKSLGYATHAVGKWHLGFHKKEYTPLYRGFDTHFGLLGAMEDYYNRTACSSGFCGTDFQVNGEPSSEFIGQYSTNLFTDRAEDIIDSHNDTDPMFLYMAYNAPHSPMQVPQNYLDRFAHVEDKTRRIYLGMVAAMDEGVGNITAALKRNKMWEDTVVIFMADNGGSHYFGGDNSPLRGEKATLWEGGIRGVTFVAGHYIRNRGVINRRMIHISDWYPTLMNLAGGNAANVNGLDGYDQWRTITRNTRSPRYEFLININPIAPRKGKSVSPIFDTTVRSALRLGDWKIITGDPRRAPGWIPSSASVSTTTSSPSERDDSKNVYLFDIASDPEERLEVSADYPGLVHFLLSRLAHYNRTAVPVSFPATDERCDPLKHEGFWVPWNEY